MGTERRSPIDRRAGLAHPAVLLRLRRAAGASATSATSSRSTAWLAAAGQRVLQLLPLNEMAPGQQSPYSAISAMAIDPIFISVPDVPEFEALGGEASLTRRAIATRSAAVRRAPRIEYAAVRALKQAALRAAFERFYEPSGAATRDRAPRVQAFLSEQAWWIEDYALFRAHSRARRRAAVDRVARGAAAPRAAGASIARAASSRAKCCFYQYLQWLADAQWRERARRARTASQLFGDLPFMVDGDSADVWARQHQFRLDVSVGAPPDAFSATGQDWGMPVYRWDAMAGGGLPVAARARAPRAPISSTATASITSSASTAPTAGPKDGGDAVLHAARRAGADGARRAGARRSSAAAGRRDRRRGSRHRARLRARVARAARRARASACFAGSGTGTTEGQPFRDPADYPAAVGRDVGHARHRAARRLVGGRVRRRAAAGRRSCRRSSG